MASPKKRMELGATPGRLCLGAVLGIILIVVLYSELSHGDSANAQTTTVPSPRPAGARPPRSTATATHRQNSKVIPSDVSPPQSPNDRDIWNAVALDSAFKHDPFAVPAAFLPPPSENSAPIAQEPTSSVPRADNSLALDMQQNRQGQGMTQTTLPTPTNFDG